MIESGANNLYNNRKMVDELNVFPVPDGDTGTNMSLTAAAVAKELTDGRELTVTKAADAMAFAALRGARGNSGVILSQIFRGMSKSLKGKEKCGARDIAEALAGGSDAAYKAVMKPTEGTILTVAREAAQGALSESGDIEKVLEKAVSHGAEALVKTTLMLPALRQAGVVDAGGQGFMLLLEGALEYIRTGSVTAKEESAERTDAPVRGARTEEPQSAADTEDIKFRYCTEFIIEKNSKDADAGAFRNAIASKGDCMLVIDDDDIVKVHIHTNHPGFVLEEAVKIGELINLKIDNMKRQHKTIIEESADVEGNAPVKAARAVDADKKKAARVKAPKKEKPPKKPAEIKNYGFAAVCMGKGMSEILGNLGVDRIIEGGQTMNPSTSDILKAVSRIKAKTVFVFPNNKNIIMAASQASQLAEDKRVIVIPTSSIPQCISAMMAFSDKKDAGANEKSMTSAASGVKIGQLTYAVRDTEIEGRNIKKGDILGMTEGKITSVGKDIDDVLESVISDMTDSDTEFITVYCGKDVKKSQAERMRKALEAKYERDEIEVEFKRGGQPLYYYIISVE